MINLDNQLTEDISRLLTLEQIFENCSIGDVFKTQSKDEIFVVFGSDEYNTVLINVADPLVVFTRDDCDIYYDFDFDYLQDVDVTIKLTKSK